MAFDSFAERVNALNLGKFGSFGSMFFELPGTFDPLLTGLNCLGWYIGVTPNPPTPSILTPSESIAEEDSISTSYPHDVTTVIRFLADLVGIDGSRAHDILNILSCILSNTFITSILPEESFFLSGNGSLSGTVFKSFPNSVIFIHDIIFSSSGISDCSFFGNISPVIISSLNLNDANGSSFHSFFNKSLICFNNDFLFFSVNSSSNWQLLISYSVLYIE